MLRIVLAAPKSGRLGRSTLLQYLDLFLKPGYLRYCQLSVSDSGACHVSPHTLTLSPDLILLQLSPCPVRQLVGEDSHEKDLGYRSSKGLVEVGLLA